VMWAVIALTAAIVILDGLDGRLARATGMSSEYGARFDMETDAAFILVLSILVWQHGKAGVWVLMCGLMRYGFVAAGRLMPWMAAPLRATLRGRIVAVSQLVGLGVALAPIVPAPASTVAAGLTLAALTWSFGLDIAWLARQRHS
jgi:phosphatidylglycerophosphate synthase